MAAHIGIVQIGHPGPTDESEYDTYWTEGVGSRLRAMYRALLDMVPIHIGYHKLVHEDGRIPEIGFEYSPADVRPRWPDPAYPQQVHLDVAVPDLDASARLAGEYGARLLATFDDHRVLEDPAGHPFCLYPGDSDARHGEMSRIVLDCFSPRALASFYEQLFDMRRRVVDTPNRVELAGGGHRVALVFQHSTAQAPRWPDPLRPHQLHLDVVLEEPDGREKAERFGAMRLDLLERPDHHVYADPAGHPFCLGIGIDGWPWGPAQVAGYERWLAEHGSAG